MSYQVLARKYRPKNFDSLVGQEHVVRALSHALASGRLHHAYLFTGTRGVGKTTLSRILAKSLNCIGLDGQGGITAEPCGVCEACVAIDAGRFVDYIEMDAASNRGVDEMAALLEQAVYAPSNARFKVYMIDEVHMLTNHAFNAMLKTLEEPPEHVKFILATTDPQKIPVTVLSRCLQFNLKQMPPGQIIGHLEHILGAEAIEFDTPALRLLAQGAHGSMRDALSLTDQAIAYAAGKVTLEAVQGMLGALDQSYLVRVLDALVEQDGAAMLAVAHEMASRSLSYNGALQDLATLLHHVALAQAVPAALPEDLPERADVLRLAGLFDAEETQLFYQIAVHGRNELGLAPDEFAGFSMTLLRMLAFRPAVAPPAPPPAGAVPPPRTAPARAAHAMPAPAARAVAAPPVPARSAAVPPAADLPVSATPAPARSAGLSPAMAALAAARSAAANRAPARPAAPEPAATAPAAPAVPAAEVRAPVAAAAPAPAPVTSLQTPVFQEEAGAAEAAVPAAITDSAAAVAPAAPTAPEPARPAPPAPRAIAPSARPPAAAPAAPARARAAAEPPPWATAAPWEEDGGWSGGPPPAMLDGGPDGAHDDAPEANFAADFAAIPAAAPAAAGRARQSAPAAPIAPPVWIPVPQLQWDGDWPALAQQLPVRGVAQQLALQAELAACEADSHTASFRLVVPIDTWRTQANLDKLSAALSEHFGRKVQVSAELGAAVHTGSSAINAARARRQEQAEQTVHGDPFVQAMLREFDASVVPGSIRPLAG